MFSKELCKALKPVSFQTSRLLLLPSKTWKDYLQILGILIKCTPFVPRPKKWNKTEQKAIKFCFFVHFMDFSCNLCYICTNSSKCMRFILYTNARWNSQQNISRNHKNVYATASVRYNHVGYKNLSSLDIDSNSSW